MNFFAALLEIYPLPPVTPRQDLPHPDLTR